MFNLKQNLLSVGLTEEEILVYFATLQPHTETILKVAQHTGIPRTTVYILIENLIEKGFIREVSEGKKKHYYPAPPEKIIQYATTKKQQFTEVISQLQQNIPAIQALYNFQHTKPQLKYFEGNQMIAKLLQSTVGDEELCLHLMSEEGAQLLGSELDDYRTAIVKHLTPTREIISDSLANHHAMKSYASARNRIKYLPATYATNVDYILYPKGMILITYKNELPLAVSIEDKYIMQFETVRFNLIWEHPLLKEDDK